VLIGDKFDPKAFPASLRAVSAALSVIIAGVILLQLSLAVGAS
jgi:hypothetical protein